MISYLIQLIPVVKLVKKSLKNFVSEQLSVFKITEKFVVWIFLAEIFKSENSDEIVTE